MSSVFARGLSLRRSLYLIPYVGFSSLFLYAYARWSDLSVGNLLRHHWIWGLVGGVVLAAWTVKSVLSQPASPRLEGFALGFDILWSGVIYGLADALLLSVFPVVASWQAFTPLGWTSSWPIMLLVGVIALLASLFVTIAYHVGYSEYRGKGMVGPVIGNAAMTLGYLVTTNPLAAVVSHIAMHIAGVVHGPASVVQLPPHYKS
jgi:hypothetical protein